MCRLRATKAAASSSRSWTPGWTASNRAEFGGRVLAGADCANKGGHCTAGPATHDGCGHGTHVAGTIASANWGVAPEATILPVRVLTDPDGHHPDECTGSTDDVAAGIRWATTHGARVINLSLAAVKGVASASPVTVAVQQAVQAGVVVVFAAGNTDKPVADSYGGRALIVAATGPSGALASYSQHGAGVTVAAPGGDPKGPTCAADGSDCVVSTWLKKEYAALAGTSMAAPHVSGLAALLIGQQPSRSESDVVHTIEAHAHPLAGAGHGRIDAAAALGVPAAGPTPTSHPTSHSPSPTHRATQAAHGPTEAAADGPSEAQPGKPGRAGPSPTASGRPRPGSATHGQRARETAARCAPAVAASCSSGLAAGLLSAVRRSPA